jgi:hypothetical protein
LLQLPVLGTTGIYVLNWYITWSWNWSNSGLGTHFPDDAHGLGFFDGSNLFEHPDRKRVSSRLEKFDFNYGQWGTLLLD